MFKKLYFLLLIPILIITIGCVIISVNKDTLKDAFANKFLIGVAVNRTQINKKNTDEVKLITSQFNSLTPENEMKWMYIQPKIDEFNFEQADKFVELGESNNMFVIGHNLVWHSQLAPGVFKADDGSRIDSAELINRIGFT